MYHFRIAKWGNSLAVRLPRGMVKDLRLEEGDSVPAELILNAEFLRAQLAAARARSQMTREEALAAMNEAARTFPKNLKPEDWKIDRDSLEARG